MSDYSSELEAEISAQEARKQYKDEKQKMADRRNSDQLEFFTAFVTVDKALKESTDDCQKEFCRFAEAIARFSSWPNLFRTLFTAQDARAKHNEAEVFGHKAFTVIVAIQLVISAVIDNDEFDRSIAYFKGRRKKNDHSVQHLFSNFSCLLDYSADRGESIKIGDMKERFGITNGTLKSRLKHLRDQFKWYEGRYGALNYKRTVSEVEAALVDHALFVSHKIDYEKMKRILIIGPREGKV